jgi:hypothetical protein
MPPTRPTSPVPQTRTLPAQLQTLQQQFLALEEEYRTELKSIEKKYETALTQAATAAPHHHRRKLWHAYAQARRRQREVYREARRQWDALFTRYRQMLLGQREATE